MNIDIIEIKELENGGAEIILDLDSETTKYLINEGFISALTKGIAKVEMLWDENIGENNG